MLSVEGRRQRFRGYLGISTSKRNCGKTSQNARIAAISETVLRPIEHFASSRLRRSINQMAAGFLVEDTVDLKLTDKVALVTGATAGRTKTRKMG
jgi:hypothetical protein